jgi:succinate dehydrogenase/fumarate reductase cytochrome b subunit
MIEWLGIITAVYLLIGIVLAVLIVTSKDFEKGISEYTRPNLAIKLFFALVITVAWVVVLKFEGFDAKVQLKKGERK